jgi:gliding motility-associated-like protein
VINRWGKVVFESTTDIPGWDGTVNGKPQPIDGYVWEAEAVDAYGNIIRRKGTVTLIR